MFFPIKMKRQNVRTLSLIVCTFIYLLLGAAVFDALESRSEEKQKNELEFIQKQIKQNYNMTDEDFNNLENTIIKLVPHNAGVQWKFAGSFFFCMTVITTIGYGHSAPHTSGGKVFCMIYALIGIPLNLVMFQSVGERLNVLMGFGVKKVKGCLRFKKVGVSHTELCIIGGLANIIITVSGSLAFVHFEKWNFLDALYYVVITLTTVGFGDYVALQKDNVIQEKPEYVFFSIIYILVALVVLASVMNLLVLRLLTLNTEDERREAQEQQEIALRHSAGELNHIDTHMNFYNHNHARGPLLEPHAKGEHRPLCQTCTCNSKARHRTNADSYAVDFNVDTKTAYANNYSPAVYSTLYSEDAEVFDQFLNSDRSGKRASI
ncbi:two pore potassium channel protein sup-9-like [Diadema antillarum]|uniref:two pore potassium channel protein sup-9-like n=1 Tax=Diadema antillarum TaxID=105358 RepID=UPI003A89BCCD